jgi:hypothetical protein
VGRLTGWGFETSSEIFEVQEVIDEITEDPRNRLYSFWPKFVGRAFIEGELFLLFTVHPSGFVEIDFIDPALIAGNGDDDTGILFHSSKTFLPLFYNVTDDTGVAKDQIPSIFLARYPELIKDARKHDDYDSGLQQASRDSAKKFKSIGGYNRFVVAWDRGFLTRRAISYLRTTLEWLNHYENLKKYEIDHKKSSGSYLWIFKFTDIRAFKTWLALSDDDRRKTGIMQKKTPGGSLVLPPGIDVECKNPNLTSIKDQDTDILQMVGSGLNEPQDIMTGAASGPFASVKASRGPMSDRTSDEIAYFDRFQKHDFWGNIFFLRSMIAGFPKSFKVREAVKFDKNQEPVFKPVKKRPEQTISISYPTSEVTDYEARATGLLGSKHGPVSETLGIPKEEVAQKMGIGGYGRARLRKATEDDRYPELVYTIDAESIQEKAEGEPKKGVQKKVNDPKKPVKKPKKT